MLFFSQSINCMLLYSVYILTKFTPLVSSHSNIDTAVNALKFNMSREKFKKVLLIT